jgi:hypothetical protein
MRVNIKSYPITGLDSPLGHRKVGADLDNRRTIVVSCKPYTPTTFTPPGDIPGTQFC